MLIIRKTDVIRGELFSYHSHRFRSYTSRNYFLIIEDGFVPRYPQFPAEILGDRVPKATKDGFFDERARELFGPILKKLNHRAWGVEEKSRRENTLPNFQGNSALKKKMI